MALGLPEGVMVDEPGIMAEPVAVAGVPGTSSGGPAASAAAEGTGDAGWFLCGREIVLLLFTIVQKKFNSFFLFSFF